MSRMILANKGVTWAVSCSGADCGTISPTSTSSGAPTTYTAPAAIPTGDLNVLVTATSGSDLSVVGSVPFIVPGTAVSIDMQSATELDGSGKAQLSATVSNEPSDQGVTWTVSCSPSPCGSVLPTVTKNGVVTTYTAPSTPPDTDLSVTLTATSVFNNGATNFATIIVHAVTVAVAPGSVLLPIGVTQDFTATVAHDPGNKGVAWTVAQNGAACAGCGTAAPSKHCQRQPIHLHAAGGSALKPGRDAQCDIRGERDGRGHCFDNLNHRQRKTGSQYLEFWCRHNRGNEQANDCSR